MGACVRGGEVVFSALELVCWEWLLAVEAERDRAEYVQTARLGEDR